MAERDHPVPIVNLAISCYNRVLVSSDRAERIQLASDARNLIAPLRGTPSFDSNAQRLWTLLDELAETC
jgi:hypothetical protein